MRLPGALGRVGPCCRAGRADLVRAVPAGISSAELGITVVPGPGGGSLVRADAEVVWYPPRPPAEHIDAWTFTVVRVTVWPGQRPVTRVFRSAAIIARLAGLLNALRPPIPPGPISCPQFNPRYLVAFARSPGAKAAFIVAPSACYLYLDIHIGGRVQPPLTDPAGSLYRYAYRLLGKSPTAG